MRCFFMNKLLTGCKKAVLTTQNRHFDQAKQAFQQHKTGVSATQKGHCATLCETIIRSALIFPPTYGPGAATEQLDDLNCQQEPHWRTRSLTFLIKVPT